MKGKVLYDIEIKMLKNIRNFNNFFVYLYESQILYKMKIKKNSGIYIITNMINNKSYVGQSKNIYRRFIHHKSMLRKNIHSNPYLQNAFNKYGEENFKFDVLEYCNIEDLTIKEKYYLSLQQNCYNLKDVTDFVIHPKRKYCKIAADKISKALKGKIPKNLNDLHLLRKRKIAYYVNDVLEKTFESCTEAADYFKISLNSFINYVNKNRKQKNRIYSSKYFGLNYKLEYYE